MESLSVTAQSRDGVVEATIDIIGTAPTVLFVDKRLRDMPDSELADEVLDALATAQAEAVLRINVLRTYAESWLPAGGVLARKRFGHTDRRLLHKSKPGHDRLVAGIRAVTPEAAGNLLGADGTQGPDGGRRPSHVRRRKYRPGQ
jgi:hypothetical protein